MLGPEHIGTLFVASFDGFNEIIGRFNIEPETNVTVIEDAFNISKSMVGEGKVTAILLPYLFSSTRSKKFYFNMSQVRWIVTEPNIDESLIHAYNEKMNFLNGKPNIVVPDKSIKELIIPGSK